MKMKNVWRKLFKRNRPLTNQHGPTSISRDEKGKWILDKTETSIDKFIAELTQELVDEGKKIKANPVPKPRTKSQKEYLLDLGNQHISNKKDDCKCKDHTPVAKKPQVKKPASATKAVSKAKVAKPATAKPTPKKPKSK
jgi:hypothetical protein